MIQSADMLSLHQARDDDGLKFANSYTRMAALLALSSRMEPESWLRLLGENWTICDDLYRHKTMLSAMLGDEGPRPSMMEADEFRAWEDLPPTVTVYRGAGARNANGISWSLDREVAARFPFLNRYKAEDPTLFTARVEKRNVLAIKGDRNEREVITFSARIVESERLVGPV